MDNALAQFAAPASIAASALALALLYLDIPKRKRTAGSVPVSILIGVLGSAAWIVVGAPLAMTVLPALVPGLAALAGLAAIVATFAVREATTRLPVIVAWCVLWSLTVFVPVTISIYSSDGLFRQLGYFPLDHGGAIPALVAAGGATTAVLIINRRMPRPLAVARSASSAVVASAVLLLAWTFWLVSMELAIDEATPRIVLNTVLAGGFGIAGWLIVERIHHEKATLAAASAGLVSGLSSITAGAAYLDPLWAAVIGLVAGVLSATFVYRRVRISGRTSWFVVGAHAIAPGVGLVLLGMFAEGIGMLFTGQPAFLVAEILVALVVFGYSVVVSAVLWLILRLVPGAPPPPAAPARSD